MTGGEDFLAQDLAIHLSVNSRWMAASLNGCLLVMRNAWEPTEARRVAQALLCIRIVLSLAPIKSSTKLEVE